MNIKYIGDKLHKKVDLILKGRVRMCHIEMLAIIRIHSEKKIVHLTVVGSLDGSKISTYSQLPKICQYVDWLCSMSIHLLAIAPQCAKVCE